MYGEPEEELGRRAARGEVVLGGCLIWGNDPAWSCSECGLRFGDRAKPHKVPKSRSRDEWIDMIRTMLPAPVHASQDGELLAGEPVVVIVRFEEKVIQIMEAGIEWSGGAHSPTLKGQPFAKVPFRTPAARVAELIAMAWGKRVSRYRWCPRCRQKAEQEHMSEAICHGCAEKVRGVVF